MGQNKSTNSFDKYYDYIVIGSGFGGSVSALRLAQKGYKVLIIEKGKWYNNKDFPKTNWNLRKWLWLPSLKLHGIMKMTFFKHIGIISGVGVGGGSLVYANTLPKPKKAFYNTGSWAGITNWEKELEPHYETAWKMLGAAINPKLELGDNILKDLADSQDRPEHFEPTKVAVFFGEADKTVNDPYFEGKGPERSGCNMCGACMTGCRYNAKNTLDKNYLHLAQKLGVKIIAEKEVIDIKPLNNTDGLDGYELSYQSSTSYFKKVSKIQSRGVILSGGVLGTVKLLLKLKQKSLTKLSEMVGQDIRSNNESLIFSVSTDKEKDFSKGIAIGSIYHPDENTHLEPVRYGRGSGFWRLGMTPNVADGNVISRLQQMLTKLLSSPKEYIKRMFVRDFAKQSIVLLFMQHIDSKLRFQKGLFGMKSSVTEGEKPVASIPLANKLADEYGKKIGGKSMVLLTETLFNIPSTAHILGGSVIGEDPSKGVIDKNHRVFNYKNLYVIDGSAISANPGVNPSLTITAMAERAMQNILKK
ncbi:MAG: GMC family oxidoreductase [Marinilabiliales bacterium]|nr:MAG: GMC family oxidoreductase [Marinilabiliales bacterium]